MSSGAMFAMTAAQATMEIMAGSAASKQGKLNAKIYEQQAGFIDEQKVLQGETLDLQRDIDLARLARENSGTRSTLIANTAAAGLEMSGSPMAVMLDNLTQAGIEESIIKYNYAVEKNAREYNLEQKKISLKGQAAQEKFAGSIARNKAYSNAFSTMMKGSYDYGVRKGYLKTGNTEPGVL